MPVGHGEKVQFYQPVFTGFLAEERQFEDIFCSPARWIRSVLRINYFDWGAHTLEA